MSERFEAANVLLLALKKQLPSDREDNMKGATSGLLEQHLGDSQQ